MNTEKNIKPTEQVSASTTNAQMAPNNAQSENSYFKMGGKSTITFDRTVTPRATQARTNIKPGSDMPGVPASEMSAITSPAAIRAAKASAVWCSLNLWCDTNWFFISKCLSSMPEVRVSSAKTTSASLSMRKARRVISSRFPTGVGTKYNVPMVQI